MEQYPIEQVLPHDAPMILLSELISYHDEGATAQVNIDTHSPFYDHHNAGVPSYIGTEYMAQAIAAYAGALALDEGRPVHIGFLLGTRKYQTQQGYFSQGSQLHVTVHKLLEDESGLSVFECSISCGEKTLATAKINVFQPHDPEQFLKEQQ